jgi:hypothetical protein
VLALDRQYNYVAAAYPFGTAGTFSFGWVNYRVGNIKARDDESVVTGEYSNEENAFLISYGRTLQPHLAIGGTVKLLRHDLAGRSAAGIGFDLGLWFKPWEFLALGACAQNLQTRIYWDNPARTKETFPRLERLGAQVKPLPFINLSVDYEIVTRQKRKWHAGGEFYLGGIVGLRAGNDSGAMAFGASLLPLSSRKALTFDYGLVRDPIGHNFAHQFSLTLKFNKPQLWATADHQAIADSNAAPARVSNQTLILRGEVIEVRVPYIIISSNDLIGLQNGVTLKVYQLQLGKETGRYYGVGEAIDIRARYAIIKMQDKKLAAALKVGEKLMMKTAR